MQGPRSSTSSSPRVTTIVSCPPPTSSCAGASCDLDDPRRPGPGEARAAELGATSTDVGILDPLDSPLREEYAAAFFELRKHRGVTEEAALDAVADPSYFGTMMVQSGASTAWSPALRTRPPRRSGPRSRSSAPAGVSVVSSVFFMCLADRVLVYGDCAVNPKPDRRSARGHRDQLRRDGGRAFGIEPAHRDALLLDRRVREGRGRRRGPRRRPSSSASAAPTSRWRARSSTTPRSTRASRSSSCPGSEVAGQATVFIFPTSNGQHRVQGGAAFGERGGRRAGAAGAAPAGERPEPRVHRDGHREHGGDHGDPGPGRRVSR